MSTGRLSTGGALAHERRRPRRIGEPMSMHAAQWPETPAWLPIVSRSPEATFYHTPLWHEALVTACPEYAVATLQFTFDSGMQAVFPCLHRQEGRLLRKKTRIKSSLFGGYGGIVAGAGLTGEECRAAYTYIADMGASVTVSTNPFGAGLPAGLSGQETFTQVVRLPDDPELLHRGLSRGGKSNLSQALRKGVTVAQDRSCEALDAYCALYRDTLRRWGESTIQAYPEALFAALREVAGDHVRLWLARIGGSVIAGVIVLYWNRIAAYWSGASLQDSFGCYPNNLLHMEIMRDAVQRGFSVYDLGPSGGQDGVARFKKSLGAEMLPYATLRLRG